MWNIIFVGCEIMVNAEMINEIRRSVDIVDVISDYIPVEQKGKNYFSICPFHDDHNPSLSISPEKQIYTCFVCGAHGNVFNFLMEYDNISFAEALKKIADRVGITLNIASGKEQKTNNLINDLYSIYDVASKYYQNNLLTKDGIEAQEYLKNRGFTDEIIKTFGVGLSTRTPLAKILKSKGFKDDLVTMSGICSISNGVLYDTFVNRIMFPLCDLDGKVVGFSGRIYKTKDDSKYVNSKESDIFKKSELLYNYHRAKEYCRKKKSVIIVEGFMDVIALHMVGIYNVVASMGTAITKEHAKLLKKLSTNVIMCFDGDNAGNKATLACAKELNNIGIYPKVIRLPEKLDPDEFIKKYGVDKFVSYVENPKSLLDYRIDEFKKETNFSDSDDVAKYIKNVVLELENETDPIIREIIIKKLSDDTNISVATINGMLKGKTKIKKKAEKKVILLNKYEKAERRLIFYMIRYPEVIRIYEKNKCYIPTKEFRYLANEIIHYFNKQKSLLIADFLSYLSDKKELLDAFNLIDTMDISENYSYEEIMDYINILNKYNIEEQIKKLTNDFKKETDEIKKIEIFKEISNLKVRV